jgi:chaperone modulatory protein CbpM
MISFEAVIAMFPDLDAAELTGWVEQRWVRPEQAANEVWIFHEIDVARVRLIYDLRRQLDTQEESLPVLLSLLDQIYELRRQLKAVTQAVEKLPPEMRAEVLAAFRAYTAEP